jgi:hypothetical protein
MRSARNEKLLLLLDNKIVWLICFGVTVNSVQVCALLELLEQ